MKTINKFVLGGIITAVFGYSPLLLAEGGEGEQRQRRGPPKAALQACEGKSVGDKVTFQGRRGHKVNAVCKMIAVPDRATRQKMRERRQQRRQGDGDGGGER